MTLRRLIGLLVLAPILGCGQDRNESVMSKDASVGGKAAPLSPAEGIKVYGGGEATKDATALPTGAAAIDPAKAVARKILYSADLNIVVEDFPRTTDALAALVRRMDGYIADSNVMGTPGVNRLATWKVRVPVARFEAFLDAVVKLGELQHKKLTSQDVTEEFFDLETRIKNKKVEEDRLVKHLTESTGKLTDILAVEREISRVREEIERMEGRIRLLANLAELTTVSVTAQERVGYVPPTAPSFSTRASRAFERSVKNLVELSQFLAIQAIAILPWLPFWIVVAAIVLVFLRRHRRHQTARTSTASHAP